MRHFSSAFRIYIDGGNSLEPRKKTRIAANLRVLLGALLLSPIAQAQYVQQAKLFGSGARGSFPAQGVSVAITADGNTAVIGENGDSYTDGGSVDAGWIFTRSNGVWTQQGSKLIATSTGSPAFSGTMPIYGSSTAISGDGSTAILGGEDGTISFSANLMYYAPAAWVFTRSGQTWRQQDEIFPGTDSPPPGSNAAVGLSQDGSTLVVGSGDENYQFGSVRVYARNSNGFFNLTGSLPTATGAQPPPGSNYVATRFGASVAISADGNTVIVGGPADHGGIGAVWIYVRSNGTWVQQGGKLTANDAVGASVGEGLSVAISADGNTVVVGGPGNGSSGAAWVYFRANGQWSQQGSKLVGSGAIGNASQGRVAISSDGNTILVGGPADNSSVGAAWVFTRSNGVWSPKGNKLVATSAIGAAQVGSSVAMSADGNTILLGAPNDNGTNNTAPGAVFVFGPSGPTGSTPVSVSPPWGSASSQVFTVSFNDPNGWQDLDVVNILINNFLDGRNSCYLAYSRSANVLYLVANDGRTLMGLPVNGSGSVSNSQCTVNGAGTTASGTGNVLTLAVNLTFANYAGNKIVYTAARDLHGGNSGWQALGVWNVPGVSTFPSAVSVGPAQGSGASQTFTFTFSDTKGAQDLGVVNVLMNNFLDGRQACYIAYSQPFKVLYLVGDAGGGLSAGLMLGGSGSVSNSQCTINASGSSATTNGNTLTLVLNMSFTAGFAGNRVIYTAARDSTDANNSGWQSLGTWNP
jgi:hypothetical protein